MGEHKKATATAGRWRGSNHIPTAVRSSVVTWKGFAVLEIHPQTFALHFF